jgi:hypothetical protein
LKLVLKGIVLLPGAALLLLFLFLYLNLLLTTRPLSVWQLFVYLGIPALEVGATVAVFVRAKRKHLDWTLPFMATIWGANVVNIVVGLFRVFGI